MRPVSDRSGATVRENPAQPDAAIDRRVARTRNALAQALFTLIASKGYPQVTVDDICATADVGRSTFYSHFPNKDALKRYGIDLHLGRHVRERQAQALQRSNGQAATPFAFTRDLLDHAHGQIGMYRTLVAQGGSEATLEMMRDLVTDLTRRELSAMPRLTEDRLARDVAVAFVTGAFIHVLTHWLDGGARPKPEHVDLLFRQLALHGVVGMVDGTAPTQIVAQPDA